MATPEGKVKQWCRKKGGAFDHYFPGHVRVSPRGGPFGQSGVADDILCWHGIFVAIEVKAADGDPTVLQTAFLTDVIAAGGVGAVLRGRDEAKLSAIRARVLEQLSVADESVYVPPRKYLYWVWYNMVDRCTNECHPAYDAYGGRGIFVADELVDYRRFCKWIIANLGHRPSNDHSLDRIDNDGPYAPGNLRWATRIEQALNRRPVQGPRLYKNKCFDDRYITYDNRYSVYKVQRRIEGKLKYFGQAKTLNEAKVIRNTCLQTYPE